MVISWTSTADNGSVIVTKGVKTKTITGLTNETSYTFTVKTVDTTGNTSTGTTITRKPSATPDATAPGEVSNLTAAAGNAAATLTWTDPADSDFSEVVISWTSTAGNGSVIVAKGVGTKTITGLANGTAYTFTAKTTDTTGNTSTGTSKTATPAIPVAYDGQIYREDHSTDEVETPSYAQGEAITNIPNSVIKVRNNLEWANDYESVPDNWIDIGNISNSKVTLNLPATVPDSLLRKTAENGEILAGVYGINGHLQISETEGVVLRCLDNPIPKTAYLIYANAASTNYNLFNIIIPLKQGWNFVWRNQWGEATDYTVADRLQDLYDAGYRWYYTKTAAEAVRPPAPGYIGAEFSVTDLPDVENRVGGGPGARYEMTNYHNGFSYSHISELFDSPGSLALIEIANGKIQPFSFGTPKASRLVPATDFSPDSDDDANVFAFLWIRTIEGKAELYRVNSDGQLVVYFYADRDLQIHGSNQVAPFYPWTEDYSYYFNLQLSEGWNEVLLTMEGTSWIFESPQSPEDTGDSSWVLVPPDV